MAIILYPSFTALDKNDQGLLDWSSVRYLVHNYFATEHGWVIRGLEPLKAASPLSDVATDDSLILLQDKVPYFLSTMLEGERAQGFGLDDVVRLLTVLEQLILDETLSTLHAAYFVNDFADDATLTDAQLDTMLESFLLLFAFGNRRDKWNHAQHAVDRKRVHKLWPDWDRREAVIKDIHRNYVYANMHQVGPFTENRFSFEDAAKFSAMAAQQFGKIHDIECLDLKDGLAELDPAMSGRVPLKSFYKKGKIGYWHLGESADYLRQLGALDESSSLGPQVIIPNYVNAVSNCDAPSDYFSVCCINECESLLNQFERHIKAPTATVPQILAFAANLSSPTVLAPRNLSSLLTGSLSEAAGLHGGKVRLHGRLFAQWLHFAFPQECPFPHMSDTANPMTPTEWKQSTGQTIAATEKEWYQVIESSETYVAEPTLAMWTLDEEMRTGVPIKWTLKFVTIVQVVVGCVVLFILRQQLQQLWLSAATAAESWGGQGGALKKKSSEHLV